MGTDTTPDLAALRSAAAEQLLSQLEANGGCSDEAADAIGVVLAEVEVLRAENERLRDEAVNALVQQTALKGMTVEEGAAVLQLGPPRELVIAWVDAARKMLGDAPNYSETRIDFPSASMGVKAAGEVERYVFTVQRAGKLTPHEARQRVETERDELRARVAELEAGETRTEWGVRFGEDVNAHPTRQGALIEGREYGGELVQHQVGPWVPVEDEAGA